MWRWGSSPTRARSRLRGTASAPRISTCSDRGVSPATICRSASTCSTAPETDIPGSTCRRSIRSTKKASAAPSRTRWRCGPSSPPSCRGRSWCEQSLPAGEGGERSEPGGEACLNHPTRSSLREEPPSPEGEGELRPRGLARRIILRRLAALEHPVIADDADFSVPRRAARRLPAFRCRRIAPGREQNDLAGGVDAGEDLLVDQPGGPVTKLEP